jgi:hypothetical protein
MVEAEQEKGTGSFGQAPQAHAAPQPTPAFAPPPPAPATNWDRIPDKTVVKIQAKFADKSRAKVSMTEVKKLVDEMATSLAIPIETYKLEGKELSDFFVLRFGPLDLLAAKQALAFVKGTKLPDGGFRDFTLLDPSGTQATLFLNLDKNGHASKLEGALRRLSGHIVSAYPHLKPLLYARRHEGILNCHFKILATIVVTPDVTCLPWDPKKAAKHGIDMFAIKKAFLEEENIEWCS